MSKHTPGPWYAKDDGYIMSSGTDELGGVVGYFNATDEDLRLAAAAPDLLEALESIVSRLEHSFEYTGVDVSDAKAIIARAKGESS